MVNPYNTFNMANPPNFEQFPTVWKPQVKPIPPREKKKVKKVNKEIRSVDPSILPNTVDIFVLMSNIPKSWKENDVYGFWRGKCQIEE